MNVQNIIKSPMFITLCVLAVIVVILFGLQYVSESKFTLQGTLTLTDKNAQFEKGKPCSGDGGYNDIREMADVKIRNGSDDIIAVSQLQEGEAIDSSTCKFSYVVNNVPRTSIYQIEVSDRGNLTYSYDKLKSGDFTVDSTLGE